MEALFNKRVRVNEEQFDELMELLEKYTDFKWYDDCNPTMYKPGSFTDLGYTYIQFWDDYILSHYKVSEGKFDLINFEEAKQILTINQ